MRICIEDLSIKVKLLLWFLLFSALLISTIGVFFYSKTSAIINKQAEVYSDTVLGQVIRNMENLGDEVLKVSVPIVTHPDIQGNDFSELNDLQMTNRRKAIESDLSSAMDSKSSICSLYVCTESGEIFSPNAYSRSDKLDFHQYGVYIKGFGNVIKPVWTGIHENEFKMDRWKYVLTFSRALYDKDRFKPFGALIINISNDVLFNICMNEMNRDKYRIFIVSRTGEVILNSIGVAGLEPIDRDYVSKIIHGDKKSDSFNWTRSRESLKIKYVYSPKLEWYYIAEVPMDYLLNDSKQVGNYLLMIALLSLIASLFAAYMISSSFTVPFSRMIDTMRKVENGNFDIHLQVRNKSEIGQLAASYVRMVGEIKKLIQRVHEEHTKKREAELAVLQAQVTPHFLYNTLNSIRCLAGIQNADAIEKMTAGLIELLQISISKRTKFIPLREEVEVVKKYMILQNFRYGNRYEVIYSCDEEVVDRYYTLKMILQPLVENSLRHGFGSSEIHGVITIRVFPCEKGICLEVEDNGRGMSEKKIRDLMAGIAENDNRFSGIGIRNIDERIKMHFGEVYGITFHSVPGECTVATVVIPRIEEGAVQQYV